MVRLQATGGVCARVVVLGALLAIATVPVAPDPAAAQAAAAPEIVTLPDVKPTRSRDRDPSARALIETWLDGYGWGADKHFDRERYEIVARRVAWGELGRAFLQFRVLPLAGDAMALAAQRCPGRTRPIEMQIYFQWNDDPDFRWWTALANRGDPGFESCSDDELWTPEQVGKIVAPPPLPEPPKITMADVVTPAKGSADYDGILAVLRPGFEELIGRPIELRPATLRVAAGFAWVSVNPRRPGGAPISEADWNAKVGACEQDPETAVAQFWMRKRDGRWSIGWGKPTDLCAGDSIGGHGYLIGAPPQLVELDDWGDRSFMPVDDPQYFQLWEP